MHVLQYIQIECIGGVYMNFSPKKTRLLMMESKLTYDRLSKQADMPLITLTQVMRGKRNPTLRTIGRIAHGLGVSAAELLEDVD